jgi:DNA ligase-1
MWKIELQNSRKKKTQIWTATVKEGEWGEGIEKIAHGQIGGAIQENVKAITKGKNIGKSNETTPFEQAVMEAKAKAQKKIDQGYVTVLSYTGDVEGDFEFPYKQHIRPMLANDFHAREHVFIEAIKDPEARIYIQPKLDGVRCLARMEQGPDGPKIYMESRGGKRFEILDEIRAELEKILEPGMVLDGELYVHGKTFQEIVGAVKKRKPLTAQIEYHVYDVITFDLNYEDNMPLTFDLRIGWLCSLIDPISGGRVKVTPTKGVKANFLTFERLKKIHDDMVRDGYEGLIVRLPYFPYALDARSDSLLKYKHFEDSEYEITGGLSEVGKDAGCIIFICKTESGQIFHVRPKGTKATRKKMLDDLEQYIGKPLTVQYQGLTDEGLPRFPVGITVRDYE